MSTKTLLLVTLSRALHDTEDALDWLWDTLQWRIKEIAPDRVINGGAELGDRDCTKIAHALGIECFEYRTNGWIYTPGAPSDYVQTARWRDADGPVVSPLERNRALVAVAVKARNEGWRVHVLGLIAPWSKTRGASHTLGQAAHYGLEVTRVECPVEYAPEVSS